MSGAPAGRLYLGHVMHQRLIPKRHQFRARVFALMVDLDRIEAAAARLRLLRLDRFGFLSLHRRDHGPRDGSALRPWVDARLAEKGIARPARVEMLSFPRMLGAGFSPLTVYYGYDPAGALSALIYEVKNTFGDQVAYVLAAGDETGGLYRQAQDKQMYVSPFIGMDQRYRFALNAPGETLALRIRQSGPEGETLIATLTGEARPLTDASLLRAAAVCPLMGVKVLALIHWHALRLALKGVHFRRYSNSTTAQEPRFRPGAQGLGGARPLP